MDHIQLRVVAQDGNEVYFKIKKTTPMKKLMDAYCDRMGAPRRSIGEKNGHLDRGAVRFLYNGQRLQDDQTPEILDMEDNDIIDVMHAQTGGR